MGLDVASIALEVCLGGIVGFTIGLTGVGGGVLLMPALTVILGMAPTLAVGTANTYAAFTKIYAVREHWRLGTVDLAAGGCLLLGALPGVVVGGLFVTHHAHDPGFQIQLAWFITAVICVSGALMIARGFRQRRRDLAGIPADVRALPMWRRVGAVVPGFGIGILLATTSTGGAVIVIPLLVFWFRLSVASSVGTSIFVSLVLTLTAGATYMASAGLEQVDLAAALWMWVGSLAGVRAGSRMSTRVSEATLSFAVVVLIIGSALAMVVKIMQTS